ncbi:hypothetical protein C789_1304 [Microcystis aeruginosa FACHB-905 = DIANCHI905]|uniref:Transmembrane protein n=1 Tax=Microcystis aeruginosa PCC 7806SL TaxID=1903187 RepID=A0AB33BEK8_MICA7|nr:hypothetical protein BH695_0139 [Microcystis aeruginosa PCC 7806SL]ELS48984.1 hypothetical protein C789_1304 [Microcystis aeruginosa FACHB-905 = DIANCHI905]
MFDSRIQINHDCLLLKKGENWLKFDYFLDTTIFIIDFLQLFINLNKFLFF